MLLLTIIAMGIGLTAVSEIWVTSMKREREQELLFIGNQFRRAITQYYSQTPAGSTQRFPSRLEDLLKDPRVPGTKRYLRKLFSDPITGENKWGVIRSPQGGIAGIYSLSLDQPVKQANFKLEDRSFESMRSYKDWIFIPRVAQGAIVIPQQPAQQP